mgnify:CR=1 FL=1
MTQHSLSLSHRLAYGAVLVAAGVLVGGAALLWARNGASVFFDTISAGIAACL